MKIDAAIDCLGIWNIGKCGFHSPISSRRGKDIIKKAYRSGIRAFDTAFSYNEADSILFSSMKELKIDRSEYQIWSKVMPVPTMERKAEASLRRLGTSYFDILMLHWPTNDTLLFSSLKALEDLKDRGCTKEIGVSNFPLPLLEKVLCDFPISYHERPLSLIWMKNWNEEKRLGIKSIAYSPGGFGLLSGKYSASNPPLDQRKEIKAFSSPYFPLLISLLDEIAKKHNSSPYAVSYSFVKGEKPWAIVRGAGKEEDLSLSLPVLDTKEREDLLELSLLVSKSDSSDNIFSHNWLLR